MSFGDHARSACGETDSARVCHVLHTRSCLAEVHHERNEFVLAPSVSARDQLFRALPRPTRVQIVTSALTS
eukprot:6192498-Pleurochrysis_carterae.AAC.2